MKKMLTVCLLALGALSVYAKDIKEFVVTTQPPMSCQNCENKIKGNLRFEKGVKKIETDLENQRVVVTYDADKTNEANLEEAFGKINYKVTKIEDCDDSCSKDSCSKDVKKCPKSTTCSGNSESCCKNKKK